MSIPRIQREVAHLTGPRMRQSRAQVEGGADPVIGPFAAYAPYAGSATREHDPHSPVASPRPAPGNTRRGSIAAEVV